MQQQLTKQTPEGFLLVGRIDAPEQPKAAVVIVHGLCEHFGRYDYVTQRLLEAGYAVVRFDHRGHGRSMGKKVWYDDRTQIVSDTDLFVEEARAQFPDLPVFMIGHSMGGFGAASYGTAHPGKLDGYVLSGAWTRDHASLASGAVEQGLDPALVASMIYNESRFNPSAVSRVGARGLMQIMPETGAWLAGKFGEAANYTPDRLFDVNTNLRYGCWYLGYLSRMFNGDPIKIACAYHAGPNNVKLWIMNYTADGQTLTLDEIPKDDSRYYAGKVVNAYDIYYQHYYPDAS